MARQAPGSLAQYLSSQHGRFAAREVLFSNEVHRVAPGAAQNVTSMVCSRYAVFNHQDLGIRSCEDLFDKIYTTQVLGGENKGFQLLEKMGWRQGTGLGKKEDGMLL